MKKYKNPLIGGMIVVLLIIAGIKEYGREKGTPKELFYVKETSLYSASLKNLKKEPKEITNELLDIEDLDQLSYCNQELKSKDEKILFFMKSKGNDRNLWDNYTLCYSKAKKKPKEVDSNLTGLYFVTDDNKVIYIKDNNLYLNNLKEKKIIDAQVSFYLVDESHKNIMWVKDSLDHEKTYDVYYQDINFKKQKVKIASNVENIYTLGLAYDMKRSYILQDNKLYLIDNQGNKEKLLNDIDSIQSIDYSTGNFYYTVDKDRTVKAMDYVVDNLKEIDSKIKEPNKDDYIHEGPYQNEEVKNYNIALNQYLGKKDRDSLRNQLKNLKFTLKDTKLYYYANGKSTLVTDQCHIFRAGSSIGLNKHDKKEHNDWVIYTKRNESVRVPKINLSDIYDVDELKREITENEYKKQIIYLDSQGRKAEMGVYFDFPLYVDIDWVNNRMYFILSTNEKDKKDTELLSISLKDDDDFGKMEVVDKEVSSIELINHGDIYYLKNMKDYYKGDLYCNGKYVASNVNCHSCKPMNASDGILCMTDMDEEQENGTLESVNNNKIEKIAENVSQYAAFSEDAIAILVDHKLAFYSGKTIVDIDTDVNYIFGQ